MSRVHNQYLDSVCFLYPSKTDAEKGTTYGGSGFFIAAPFSTNSRNHYYIVTNKHVIQHGNLTVRLETTNNDFAYWESEKRDWLLSDTDDLAIAHWVPGPNIKYRPIQRGGDYTEFLEKDWISPDGFGSGDDVFMIGRFVTHEGEQISIPTVRYGVLSISSTVSILNDATNQNQESLIVEARSIKGYSGSPVFITRIPVSHDDEKERHDALRHLFGPFLLGINWGYNVLPIEAKILNKKTKKPTGKELLQLYTNTGMMNIVPAWKLVDLLESKQATDQQQQIEEEDIMSRKGYAETASNEPEKPLTKANLNGLEKVSHPKRRPRGSKKNRT